MSLINSGVHTINQKLLAVHGSGTVIGSVNRGTHPLEITNHIARDAGMDVGGLRRELRPGLSAANGLRQIVGSDCTQRLIHIGKMLAIQFVEFAVVRGMMLRAVPPVPIAAFGNEQFFEGQFALRFAGPASSLGVKVSGLVEMIPGTI